MVSDDDDNLLHSPPIPKKKYKQYLSDSTIPVPLRTLNRWRANGFFTNDESRNENHLAASCILEDNCTTNNDNPIDDSNALLSDMSDIDSTSSMSTDENEDENEELDEGYCNENEESGTEYNDEVMIHTNGLHDKDDDIDYDCNNMNQRLKVIDANKAERNMHLPNNTVAVDEFVLDLLNLHIKHNITKAALKEVLRMQLKNLPDDNEMPKSLFKLFQYARDIAPPCKIMRNYYCKKCLFNIDVIILDKKQVKKCSLCKTDKSSSIGFFHEFEVADQIKFLFEQNNLAEKLKLTRSSSGSISDITDGTEYIRVKTRDDGGVYDLTLILNTDGLSLATSGKSHCWPLMFTIAELPQDIRDKFIIVIGFWYDDTCKPSMNLFFKPIFDKLQQCFVTGINWTNPRSGKVINTKIVAPLIVADAPARAQIQNIMSFNGRYGCNICEIRKVRSKSIVGKKTSCIFPYKVGYKLRTGKRMEAQAKILLRKNTAVQIRGVKGYSAVSCLPLIDLGTCVLPEFMHSVLLGVVKQIIGLWFGNKMYWSLKSKSDKIDAFMLNDHLRHFQDYPESYQSIIY